MIIDKIESDLLSARKQKLDTVKTLVTLFSDCQMVAKNKGVEKPTDEDCIQVIRKHLKGLHEMITLMPNNNEYLQESSLLSDYLPKQMQPEEIEAVIRNNNLTGVPNIMKFFKENFAGRYDGKMLSTIAKTF